MYGLNNGVLWSLEFGCELAGVPLSSPALLVLELQKMVRLKRDRRSDHKAASCWALICDS